MEMAPIWVVFSSDGFILGAFYTEANATSLAEVYDAAHPDHQAFVLSAMIYGDEPTGDSDESV